MYRLVQFVDITECVQNQQIDSALKRRGNLLTENFASLLKRHLAQRLNANSQGPNGPCYPGVKTLGRFFGQPRAMKIDVMDFVSQPMPLQAHCVPAESIGFNYLGTGLQIFMMYPANQV